MMGEDNKQMLYWISKNAYSENDYYHFNLLILFIKRQNQ